MKKFKNFILLPCLVLLFGACTDLEEVLVDTVTTPITQDAVDLPPAESVPPSTDLNSAYGGLRDAGTANHGSYYSLQEVTSDEMFIGAKGGDWFDGGILVELHQHTYTPTHAFVNNAWNGTYGAISTVNDLINGGTLSADDLAQSRTLRAYLYMRLMDLYGSVKINTVTGTDSPQVPRGDVYDFVESELLAALGVSAVTAGEDFSGSDLSTDNFNNHTINRYAAAGILAKLYLNAEVYKGIEMYEEAAIAADFIIEQGPYSLCSDGCVSKNLAKRPGVASDPENLEGYAAVFAPNNYNNVENIFAVYYNESAAGGMNFSQMNLHYASQFTFKFNEQPWNGYATLEEFYNSYEDGDARKANNFLVGEQLDFEGASVLDYAADDDDVKLNYTPKINELAPNSLREAGARPAKFSYKSFGLANMDNDYPIIRLGQMYLIRAEALARAAGNWNLALPDVNVVRERAKVGALTSIDADEFLAERGREMFQEGVRRTDLIRFGAYTGTWWQKPASADYTTIFPIPQEQITTEDSGLTQNPGY